MKKLALTIVSAMAMTGAAFAQGYVNWAIPTGDVTFQTNSTTFSPLFGGGAGGGGNGGYTVNVAGSFDYILLTQPYTGSAPTDANVWDGTWTGAAGYGGVEMTGANSTGLSHGGVVPATVNGQSGDNVQVNWANGTTQSVVLVGWSANLGNSWVGVSNILANLALGNVALLEAQLNGQVGLFGETPIGTVNPAAAFPGNNIFSSSSTPTATGTHIFSLNTPLYILPMDYIPTPEPGTIALAGLGGLSLWLFRRRK